VTSVAHSSLVDVFTFPCPCNSHMNIEVCESRCDYSLLLVTVCSLSHEVVVHLWPTAWAPNAVVSERAGADAAIETREGGVPGAALRATHLHTA